MGRMATKKKFKKTSRAGAAAFAIGLYLAGPQAAIAAAEGSEGAAPDSASAAESAAPAKAKAKAGPKAIRPAAGRGSLAGRPGDLTPDLEASAPESNSASRVATESSAGAPTQGGRNAKTGAGSASRPSEDSRLSAESATVRATEPAAFGNSDTPNPVASEDVSTTGSAPATTLIAAAKAAPKATAAATATVPPVLANIDARVDAAVVKAFHGLMNFISTLPVNPITSWLEGGLLMVRKSLFNQTASVSATQTVNSSALIRGKIDLIDPEGDGWTVEVVGNPSLGTVVLDPASQANGIGTIKYTYTPGEGYAGDDSFVVKVTPTDRVFNILDLFGMTNTRTYTVLVGNDAAEGNACFGCTDPSSKDTLDTTLFLGTAGATVTVEKQGLLIPRYMATVTLSEYAAQQAFAWMDTRGRTGTVSVDQMLMEDWGAFEDKASQNAVKPLLAFSYSDEGEDRAVFVDVSGVTKNDDGTYEFTGQLTADAPAQEGRVDAWDYLGIDYKAAYQRFLTASGLEACKSGQTCTTVSTVGILAATTLAPSAYVEAGGHDYDLLTPSGAGASATQTTPGSMGPGTTDVNEGNGTPWLGNTGSPSLNLTTTIPWGNDGSFITATNLTQATTSLNGVYLYTANAPAGSQPTWAPAQLIGNGWDAAVMAMTSWDQIVVDANGDMIPATFSGSVSNNILTISVPNNVNPDVLIGQSITGQGLADNTVIDGFVSASQGTVTYTVNNSVASTGTITITTPDVPTVQPGLIVVLADGAVEYWNGGGCSQTAQGCDSSETSQAYGQGWTQLQASNDAGWGSGVGVNAVITLPNYKGIVVGLSSGAVYLWDSPVLADGTIVPGASAGGGCSGDNVGSCWQELSGPGNLGVTAMIPSGTDGGFIVGYGDGRVLRWDTETATDEMVQLGSLGSAIRTLLPYDGTTLVGAISGTPVVVTDGVISEAYADIAGTALAAAATACDSSYNSGTGTGCGGYLLTVQEVKGNPITIGQQLYGGAGLQPGTIITKQLLDENGNVCEDSCTAGGAGVYLVDTPQLVAPGTPMNASNGTEFVVGLANGSVQQYGDGEFIELQNDGWGSAVNTMIPWRGGWGGGLNKGAVFYWSPSNDPGNNNDNPNGLDYAGSTVASQNSQAVGWSQLQGTGWDNAVTAMTPVGDGFAVGLTAPNNSHNGAVMLFTGFGAATSTSAFGYANSSFGPTALTPSNSFTQIANETALSTDSQGSVQQMIPITGYVTDSSGNLVLAESVITGLTNNGIYVWTGSTQSTSTTTWAQLQAPGTGSKPTLTEDQLEAAWAYGNAANSNTAWGAAGGVGATYVAASGSTPASGDPIFGLATNQAWCNTNCSSYGDYSPLVYSEQYGTDGTILSFGTAVQTDVGLSSITYGYVFYPSSIIDKFIPGKYSVAMLAAFQGGPTVTLNMPDSTSASVTESVTGPELSWYEPAEIGTFGLNVGLNASITAGVELSNAPTGPVQVAQALYTPGLLYTWNVSGYTKNMSLSSNYFSDVSYITPEEAADYLEDNATVTITPTVTPYTQATYGLFTPPSTPIIGEWTVFDLGLGYQNPISFTVSTGLSDPADLDMSVTSQGYITANAGFLPDVTSLLSWSNNFQVYSVTDQLQP